MKHYYGSKNGVNRSTIKIFSPVNGFYIGFTQESDGKLIGIQPKGFPAFFINIYHVNLIRPLNIGDEVTAGQLLGTQAQIPASDIAVGVHMPTGEKRLSYFNVMTESLFQKYRARGLNSRNAAIISRQARNANPLTCNGNNFTSPGNLANYVNLN